MSAGTGWRVEWGGYIYICVYIPTFSLYEKMLKFPRSLRSLEFHKIYFFHALLNVSSSIFRIYDFLCFKCLQNYIFDIHIYNTK